MNTEQNENVKDVDRFEDFYLKRRKTRTISSGGEMQPAIGYDKKTYWTTLDKLVANLESR